MNYAALLRIFLPVARRAGRWLIRRLVKWGLPKLIAFVECRIDTLATRRRRAKTVRRKRWLLWRMTWRRRLLAWLDKHKAKLTKVAIRKLNEAYDNGLERIPWDAVGERYGTWVRRYA